MTQKGQWMEESEVKLLSDVSTLTEKLIAKQKSSWFTKPNNFTSRQVAYECSEL